MTDYRCAVILEPVTQVLVADSLQLVRYTEEPTETIANKAIRMDAFLICGNIIMGKTDINFN